MPNGLRCNFTRTIATVRAFGTETLLDSLPTEAHERLRGSAPPGRAGLPAIRAQGLRSVRLDEVDEAIPPIKQRALSSGKSCENKTRGEKHQRGKKAEWGHTRLLA